MSGDDKSRWRSISVGGGSAGVLGTVLGVLLMVQMAGSPIGGGAALTVNLLGGGQCSSADTFFYTVSGGYLAGQCNPVQESNTIQAMKNRTKQTTEVNVNTGAQELKSNQQIHLTNENNSLEVAPNTLFEIGQAAQVRAIHNGSTASSANATVRTRVNKRVSMMQVNQIHAWDQHVQSIENLLVDVNTSSSVNSSFVTFNFTSSTGVVKTSGRGISPKSMTKATMTLANGSTKQVKVLKITEHGGPAPNSTVSATGTAVMSPIHRTSHFIGPSGSTKPLDRVWVKAPSSTSGYSPITLLSKGSVDVWKSNWNGLGNSRSRSIANVNALSSRVHDKYVAGSLNLSNYVDPMTLASQYATRYNSSGYYVQAEATAAASGFSTPNLNTTSSVTVSYQGLSYTGALLSQTAPVSGSWTVGATYNASQMSGLQMVVTTNGGTKTLKGKFTVTSIKGRSGKSLNSTQLHSYSYQTSNISQYTQMQKELNTLQQEIAAQSPTGGGGGSSFSLSLSGLGNLGLGSLSGSDVLIGGAAIFGILALVLLGDD